MNDHIQKFCQLYLTFRGQRNRRLSRVDMGSFSSFKRGIDIHFQPHSTTTERHGRSLTLSSNDDSATSSRLSKHLAAQTAIPKPTMFTPASVPGSMCVNHN